MLPDRVVLHSVPDQIAVSTVAADLAKLVVKHRLRLVGADQHDWQTDGIHELAEEIQHQPLAAAPGLLQLLDLIDDQHPSPDAQEAMLPLARTENRFDIARHLKIKPGMPSELAKDFGYLYGSAERLAEKDKKEGGLHHDLLHALNAFLSKFSTISASLEVDPKARTQLSDEWETGKARITSLFTKFRKALDVRPCPRSSIQGSLRLVLRTQSRSG